MNLAERCVSSITRNAATFVRRRLMFLLERESLITISPGLSHERSGEFMWSMNVSMPFPFPTRKCGNRDVGLGGEAYTFEIRHHYDRLIYRRRDGKGLPKMRLVKKEAKTQLPADL